MDSGCGVLSPGQLNRFHVGADGPRRGHAFARADADRSRLRIRPNGDKDRDADAIEIGHLGHARNASAGATICARASVVSIGTSRKLEP